MRKKLKDIIEKRYLPRWIVLIADMGIASATFLLTYLLRFNLVSELVDIPMMLVQFMAGLPFFLLAAIIFKPHWRIVRHTTSQDAMTLIKAHLLYSSGYFAISYWGHGWNPHLLIPWSVIIVHYFLSVSLMIFFRFLIQYIYRNLISKPNDTINVMIYGCGVMGRIAHSVIMKDANIHFQIGKIIRHFLNVVNPLLPHPGYQISQRIANKFCAGFCHHKSLFNIN